MDLLENKIIRTRVIITKKQEDFRGFYDNDIQSCLKQLEQLYPNANFSCKNEYCYFDELKIILKGTEFDVKVWTELLKIKRGETVSYNDIAIAIGNPKSVRAVGNAVGRNNISYIVPCHRVISKSGCLGGFSSGIHRKLKMLNYEEARIK
ncbi:O-6-alkylguanine-DNA alkyltransferase isoform X2 [Rhynchophorus ferrugineus]|uniref:Methylated-DNA--protein-cysteine methyltransferase n=1 Tax=Rhynchophorus ferrugineus TaxID=354439 RepID=A0A834INA6_RHYFE|nr:hypothetical protein GWI33_022689 [Rhynchophorus ferrugineus]